MAIYEQFQLRHRDYDERYWARCRAFYTGGKKLLGDKKLLREVFPPHNAEEKEIYQERCKRAWYVPYPGQLIDFIVANLMSDGIELFPEDDKVPDPFYEEFFKDVSPPGGEKQSWNQLVRAVVLEALKVKTAWVLFDMPIAPDPPPVTLLEEDKAGARRAYAKLVPAESVTRWSEDEDGELLWAIVQSITYPQPTYDAPANVVSEVYTVYTRETWERFEFRYTEGNPPKGSDAPKRLGGGPHSFGRVPLLRFTLEDGLWAMGKLEPIARAWFNLRNALSWAEYKSLFPILTALLDKVEPLKPKSDDPRRAVNQKIGQGRVYQLAKGDDVKYVGPDSAPYTVALSDLNGKRDEMHRVLHAMAQSVDNSAAAMQRSAKSKQVDQGATFTVLGALGTLAREWSVAAVEMIEVARGDAPVGWSASGMEEFEEITVEGLLGEATEVEAISIPSATFQILWKYKVIKKLLGGEASDEDYETIMAELKKAITPEMFVMPPPGSGAGVGNDNADDGDEPPPKDGEQPPAGGAQP